MVKYTRKGARHERYSIRVHGEVQTMTLGVSVAGNNNHQSKINKIKKKSEGQVHIHHAHFSLCVIS